MVIRLALLLVFGVSSCTLLGQGSSVESAFGPLPSDPSDALTIVSYNVQNLFDDRSSGREYEEFDPERSSWNGKKYLQRLANLHRTVKSIWEGGPDILVFNEIEGPQILADLHELYLYRLGYRYSASTADQFSPIQTGILSKIPILSTRTHTPQAGERLYRSVLEVEFGQEESRFVLFACHWKSKSGGSLEETEIGRRAAAEAIRRRIEVLHRQDPDLELIVAGDLNSRWNESAFAPDYPTGLVLWNAGEDSKDPNESSLFVSGERGLPSDDQAVLYTPWPDYLRAAGLQADLPRGSYVYQGNWLTIDHILTNRAAIEPPGLEFVRFSPVSLPHLRDSQARPRAYRSSGGYGYSDHFPVLGVFDWP